MRAATRKHTEAHKDEMAIRTMKRDLRRRRSIGLAIKQAQGRELAKRLTAYYAGEGEKPCVPVDCSQPSED